MGFLAPWFLGGLLALGMPVYVHLLRRHVTVPRPFSSLMFFERGIQSSTRHRRLSIWSCSRCARCWSCWWCWPSQIRSCGAWQPTSTGASCCCPRQLVQHACRNALRRCQAAGSHTTGRQAQLAKSANHGIGWATANPHSAHFRQRPIAGGARKHPPRRRPCELRRPWTRRSRAGGDRACAHRCPPLQRYAAHRYAGEFR